MPDDDKDYAAELSQLMAAEAFTDDAVTQQVHYDAAVLVAWLEHLGWMELSLGEIARRLDISVVVLVDALNDKADLPAHALDALKGALVTKSKRQRYPLDKCANGCDATPCPPSLVICKACLDRITDKLEQWARCPECHMPGAHKMDCSRRHG